MVRGETKARRSTAKTVLVRAVFFGLLTAGCCTAEAGIGFAQGAMAVGGYGPWTPPAGTTFSATSLRTTVSDRQLAGMLLGIGGTAMAALNLAFFLHLRRAYASPRRGGWRRAYGSGGSSPRPSSTLPLFSPI